MFGSHAQRLRPAAVLLALLTLVTGIAYPLLVTGLANVVFPWQSRGSVLTVNGAPVGSALIGQPFHSPRYFWGRLSATARVPYDASASSGSRVTAAASRDMSPGAGLPCFGRHHRRTRRCAS